MRFLELAVSAAVAAVVVVTLVSGRNSSRFRNRHLWPDPTGHGGHVSRVVRHPVIECIAELMAYWWRWKNSVLVLTEGTVTDAVDVQGHFRQVGVQLDMVVVAPDDVYLTPPIFSYSNLVLLCDLRLASRILLEAQEQGLFERSVSWIVFGAEFPEVLRSLRIGPRAQVTLLLPGDLPDDLRLYDVFYSPETRATESVKFASWTVSLGLRIAELLSPGDKLRGCYGREILTVATEQGFYCRCVEGRGCFSYMVDLMEPIMHFLNLRHFGQLQHTKEQLGMGLSGTFTGIVGLLHRKEADVSFNIYGMTLSRVEGAKFFGAVAHGYFAIAYNRPEATMPPTIYLLPFDLDVWGVCVCTVLLLTVTIAVAWTVPWRDGRLAGVLNGDFLVSVFDDPQGAMTKVMYTTLLVTILMLFIYYTSILTSFLTYQEVAVPFDSIEELADNYDYQILFPRNTRHHDLFLNAPLGVAAKIWQRVLQQKKEDSLPANFFQGLMKMYSGKFAFITDGLLLRGLLDGSCNVSFASRRFNEEFYYGMTRRDFPFFGFLKMGLVRASEGGMQVRILKKFYVEPQCQTSGQSLTLGLGQVVGAFFIWACGVFLSLIAMLVERRLHHHRGRRKLFRTSSS